MNRHRDHSSGHRHDGSAVQPPPKGALRTGYLIFVCGAVLGVVFQVAYAVLVVVSLVADGMDSSIPVAIFALGLPMTVTLASGAWLLHRLRRICPFADRALSAAAPA